MKKFLILLILLPVTLVCFTQPPVETVGNPVDSRSVSKYTGWTNQDSLTFTGNAEIQKIQPSNYNEEASGEGNIFFTNQPGTYFEISGFDSTFEQPANMEIHFGMYNSIYTKPDELLLEYSTDGINYSKLSYSGYSRDSALWSAMSATLSTKPDLEKLRIRFTQTSATKQFRVDDIWLRYYYLLSVKLQQFTSTLNEHSVLLSWTASSSSSKEIFFVEKSFNGTIFTALKEQSAKGSGTFNYSFTDTSSLRSKAFYRLKIKNEDGKYSYSNVLHVQPHFTAKNIRVNIYPLPAKEKLNIQIQSSKTEKAKISVIDVSGKLLITNSISLAAGINTSAINIQSLTKGVYFLTVVTSEKTETRKIVVGR